MKIVFAAMTVLFMTACNQEMMEETIFQKTIEYDLIKLCEDDEACIEAVKNQSKQCMESSDWRQYIENQDDVEELKRFSEEFYACIVDEEGNPYFESTF